MTVVTGRSVIRAISFVDAPRSKEGTESQSWQRFTLAPGLELHVRRTPVPEPFVRVLADRIRAFAATLPGEGEPGVSERNPPESL